MNIETYKEVSKTKLVVLDFYATWCGPCKALKVSLDKFKTEYPDAEVHMINIEEEADFTTEMGVNAVPTCFILKDGEIKEKIVGMFSKDRLVKFV